MVGEGGSRMTSTAISLSLSLSQYQFLALTASEWEEGRRDASQDKRLSGLVQKEIALRDASSIEMEKSENIERRAKQSQRDAESTRIEDAIEGGHPIRRDNGRDQVPRHVPEPDTQSEIDLTRHHRFMQD